MKIVRFHDVTPAVPVRPGFRGGKIQFRDLLTGTDDTPDNYSLQWVEVDGEYHTPQHRHNFEQIRIMIEGSFGFGQGLVQEAGSVGYFCEGTYYTQSASARSVTLLLQVGGPSGAGFMSRNQLRSGIDELATKGTFADGVYTWLDERGKKHNQDSYEAAWEAVNKKPLEYPKPQFSSPILFRPERFEWVAENKGNNSNNSAWLRPMGCFHERGLSISQLKVAAGSVYEFVSKSQKNLLFCDLGAGEIDGKTYDKWTSIASEINESIEIAPRTESIFWLLGLPVFTPV
jgi:hypothetical protein